MRDRRAVGPALALLLALSRAAAAAPAPAGGSAVILQEFAISGDGDPILVPVTVAGKSRLFALDTGASKSVFDVSLEPASGRRDMSRTRTPGGELRVHEGAAPQAYLGSFDLREAGPVLYSDFQGLRETIGRDVRGVVGMSFLKGYTVQLDFDAGKLRFLERAGQDVAQWGRGFPLDYAQGTPRLTAVFYSTSKTPSPAACTLDTGKSGAGSLPREDLLKTSRSGRRRRETVTTASGDRELMVARVEALSVGELQYRDLLFTEGSYGCYLGRQFLYRHTVTLDFPKDLIYLKKGEAFDRPETYDMSGLSFSLVKGRIIVAAVDEGSPARAAGIKKGDEIVMAADGERGIMALRRLLRSGEGRKVELLIRSAAGDRRPALTLRKLL